MKKIFVFVLGLLLISNVVEAAPSLSASWQTSADVLRPGSDATITLTFTNTGLTEITNVFVTATAGRYLSMSSGVGTLELGALSSASSQQGAISIRVDEDAVSTASSVTLKVEYYTGTSTSYVKTISIPITIRRTPILRIENVEYDSDVEPGKETTLKFDVVNSGDGPAKDLKIKLNQTTLFIVPSSSGEIVLNSLGASQRKTIEFPIIVDPDADVGINSIDVFMSYYDETKSDMYSETSKIGLSVTGQANFIVSVDSGDNYFYGNVGYADITISNSGTGPAEFITIVAESEYGNKEFYIGSLDPDDSESIDVIQDLRGVSSSYPITLTISYRDKFQNPYTVTKTIIAFPENAPTDFTLIIVLVVVAGVGIWYYRRRQKKK